MVKHVAILFSLVLLFSLRTVITGCAATASMSDAEYDDGRVSDPDDFSVLSSRQLFFYSYPDFTLGGVLSASPSDALADPESLLYDPASVEAAPFDDALPLSAVSSESFVNCLRFDCTVNGTSYVLLFSPAYENQLFVDSAGNLWNMGTSNIQGRVLTGTFDPYADSGILVYLQPCLGNNFTVNHNYNSPNYFRRYYWSSSDRLTYDDTYVRIHVVKSYFSFQVGDTLQYILIFLVGGGVLLCWLNRFKRY